MTNLIITKAEHVPTIRELVKIGELIEDGYVSGSHEGIKWELEK